MSLLDASLTYFCTTERVFALGPKALEIALDQHRHPGRPQKVNDRIHYELVRHGLRNPDRRFIPINPCDKDSFSFPARVDQRWLRLSYASKKVLLACFRLSKYSREAFRFTCPRKKLEGTANLSDRSVRRGLEQLKTERLLRYEYPWHEDLKVTILDPEQQSGTALYEMSRSNLLMLISYSVGDRYRLLLNRPLPDEDREVIVECPFSKHVESKAKKTLSVNVGADRWRCHSCGCGGDSVRLWGRLHYRLDHAHTQNVVPQEPQEMCERAPI